MLNKYVLLGLVSVLFLSGCDTCPTSASNEIIISDWNRPPPETILLEAYKKNSDFKVPIKNSTMLLKGKDFERMTGYSDVHLLILRFDRIEKLPVDQDYRLLLDNVYEYKISKLVPALGGGMCPLSSGLVNKCSLEKKYSSKGSITFSSFCANTIK